MKKNLQEQLEQLKKTFDLSVARPLDNQKIAGVNYLTFNIHNESFAWPVTNLKEVLKNQKIIPIPAKQEKFCGIINYKNQILAVFNLSFVLGLPLIDIKQKHEKEHNTVLVANGLPEDISVIVDILGPILFISDDEIKPKPVVVKSKIPSLIAGQIYRNQQLITILNPNAVNNT